MTDTPKNSRRSSAPGEATGPLDELQRTKLSHECAKLELEVGRLRQENRRGAVLPLYLSALGSLGAILGLGLSAWAQVNQLDFQRQQAARQDASESRLGLQKAAEMATDPSGHVDRRISGVYQLRPYWEDEKLEAVTAATLTSVLTAPRETASIGFLRCAAAEVVGKAITFPSGTPAEIKEKREQQKSRNKRIARMLYGNPQGEQGLISKMNHMLSNAQVKEAAAGAARPLPRSAEDNLNCTSATGATVEAIRKNWEYLREVNLQATDLSFAELYAADLGGTALRRAKVAQTNLRCANLANATFEEFNHSDGPLVELTNVRGMTNSSAFVQYALQNGAIEIDEELWHAWRDSDFQASAGRKILAHAFRNKAQLERILIEGERVCSPYWSQTTRPARRGFKA